MFLAFIEILSLFVSLTGYILLKVNDVENSPYMDEIFHIPQVQTFCEGKFDQWDPMITTLPGLYLTTVGLLKPVSQILSIPISTLCSTAWLRIINVLFATGNLYLLFLLSGKVNQQSNDAYKGRRLMTAFTLSVFPVLYFFTFLYYTDSGSTFCVLLTYLLSLHGNHKMAAFIGAASIMFRQTNIVWVIYVAGLTASKSLVYRIQPEKKNLETQSQGDLNFFIFLLQYVWNWILKDRKSLMLCIGEIVSCIWPYLIVIMSFIMFVIKNGSIVVGAKDDHQVIMHFPQLFYFVSFAFIFSSSHHFSFKKIKRFVKFIFNHPIIVISFMIISGILIWKWTYAHRYLLADNRHYTFYVWSKIYRKHYLVKFALIPVYLFASWNMWVSLENKHILWKVVYCVCVIANLVPSPLLEFRYFIVPYLMYRLNMPLASYGRLACELLLHILVNGISLYLFMYKSFSWENSSGVQRFMW